MFKKLKIESQMHISRSDLNKHLSMLQFLRRDNPVPVASILTKIVENGQPTPFSQERLQFETNAAIKTERGI